MAEKKESVESTAETLWHFPNELSIMPPDKTKKFILDKYISMNRLKKRVNVFVEASFFFINKGVTEFLNKPMPQEGDFSVESIYSGMTGMALLYNFYASKTKNKFKREKAKVIIEKCLSVLKTNSDCVTYLTGKSGVYVTAAEIYNDLGDSDNTKKMIKKVIDLLPQALDEKMPDILLYGRAGYLYSLLVLKKMGWEGFERDSIIRQVVLSILSNGFKTGSEDVKNKAPLMFKCYNKKYLGAAQGLCGVLFCLLLAINHVTDCERDNIIKPALDYLLTLRFKSGNLPSSLCNDPDNLVHWCHGASGASLTYVLAYRVFHDQKYLRAAEEFAEVVWKRGLSTKGYGLCHGVSGNAYSFISLFRITENVKYLYQAAKFVDWCLLMEHEGELPNSPYSLFKGIPGVAYALLDIQDPSNASFPGFQDLLLD